MSESPKIAAVYARVSTLDQEPETQLRELRAFVERRGWQLEEAHVYVDKGVSGAKDRRPALDRLMAAAKQRKVDVVVVWALDRLGRSLRHLVTTLDELGALGVDLACYTQPIDTTTPAGRLTFGVLGAVAEFERSMVRERVRAGLARARAAGTRVGRPPARVDREQVLSLRAAGKSLRQIADVVGASKNVVAKILAAS
jgi:DNA invertase Pin-like site-specific DNA recombinase